ncbi:hypothetical protein R3P38DRAFT_3204586 [Favolaschia claudopus]|uniref:Uncharacterized protein n=1 Tax=Favolaschia claudopus TaxID=2862362 RepID=A0AAW0AS90_9AGAR
MQEGRYRRPDRLSHTGLTLFLPRVELISDLLRVKRAHEVLRVAPCLTTVPFFTEHSTLPLGGTVARLLVALARPLAARVHLAVLFRRVNGRLALVPHRVVTPGLVPRPLTDAVLLLVLDRLVPVVKLRVLHRPTNVAAHLALGHLVVIARLLVRASALTLALALAFALVPALALAFALVPALALAFALVPALALAHHLALARIRVPAPALANAALLAPRRRTVQRAVRGDRRHSPLQIPRL